jgi:hypothetical protein
VAPVDSEESILVTSRDIFDFLDQVLFRMQALLSL